MLILIGTVPTAYALNRALPESQIEQFQQTSEAASKVDRRQGRRPQHHRRSAAGGDAYVAAAQDQRRHLSSLPVLVKDVGDQVREYGSLTKVPAEAVGNTRNDMYLTSEAIRFLMKDKENDLNKDEVATLNAYKGSLDSATKFIPTWVKVAVAIALGLGTMIGWKRIVVTVGEKIGKTHLTYAQGASPSWLPPPPSAPPTCSACRSRPRTCCRPVSPVPWPRTDRGCRSPTIRNMVMAWVLTLPVAILLSGTLYVIFSHIF